MNQPRPPSDAAQPDPLPIDRDRDALLERLERAGDWDEACHAAAVRYAETLFASGLEPDAVLKELETLTLDVDHAAAIAFEAQTGERLPNDLLEGDGLEDDPPEATSAWRWMALGRLLFGLALLVLFAVGTYQTWAYGRSVRITGVVIAGMCLYWGLANVRGFFREWPRGASAPPP